MAYSWLLYWRNPYKIATASRISQGLAHELISFILGLWVHYSPAKEVLWGLNISWIQFNFIIYNTKWVLCKLPYDDEVCTYISDVRATISRASASISPKYSWKAVFLGHISALHYDLHYSLSYSLSNSQVSMLPEGIRSTQET